MFSFTVVIYFGGFVIVSRLFRWVVDPKWQVPFRLYLGPWIPGWTYVPLGTVPDFA